jgi:hypothetical protein
MKFIHYDFQLQPQDVVEVKLDKQANVILMDDIEFSHYKNGQRYSFNGGLAKESPVRLRPPHSGHWNLIIDLGGYAGSVNASVNVINN